MAAYPQLHREQQVRSNTINNVLWSNAYSFGARVVDAGICYKNSSDDGAMWSEIWQVKVEATQPTVTCDGTSLILQYNVSC